MTGEAIETFPCFGGRCAVLVAGGGPAGAAPAAGAARVRRRMLAWHAQFSRFDPNSELSALNRDPRTVVPTSVMMARFIAAARGVAQRTGGLVDPTLGDELWRAGYRESVDSPGELPLTWALALAPPRRPASPSRRASWRLIDGDVRARTVTRPPGVAIDGGGILKGLLGDVLAGVLAAHPSFAIDACGDLRFGGRARIARPVRVSSPFDASIVHEFALSCGAAATSGIGRRAWRDESGRPRHHLLDPVSGRPAYTGVVQVTALAPTGVEAEMRAKAALLSGPDRAPAWLTHGGVVVRDDRTLDVVPASAALGAGDPVSEMAA